MGPSSTTTSLRSGSSGAVRRDRRDAGDRVGDDVHPDRRGRQPLPPEELALSVALRKWHPAHRGLIIQGLDGVTRRIAVTAFPLEGQGGVASGPSRSSGKSGRLGSLSGARAAPWPRPGPRPCATAGTRLVCRGRAADGSVLVLDAGTGVPTPGCRAPRRGAPHRRPADALSTWTTSRGSGSSRPSSSRIGRCTSGARRRHDAGAPGAAHAVPVAAALPRAAPGAPVPPGPPRRASGVVRDRPVPSQCRAGLSSRPDRRLPDHGGRRHDRLSPGPRAGGPGFGVDAGRARLDPGSRLAADADVLVHDAQYSATEYVEHVGWGTAP